MRVFSKQSKVVKGALITGLFGGISIASMGSLFAKSANLPFKSQSISKIAFGSCLKQYEDLSVLNAVTSKHPDLFIFGGDNVYADTVNERRLVNAYNTLGESKEYKAFRSVVPVIATWDDHDYGINDGGREHPQREMAQKVFLNFFGEAPNSERRKTPGIYTSYQFGKKGKSVNIILLDTRYFRSSLNRFKNSSGDKEYEINYNDNSTIMGKQQWEWFEQEIKRPADLTLVVSSIQMISDQHRFEKWGNYPHERKRLLKLIDDAKLRGVVLISGDRHFSEVSKTNLPSGREIYELTSSGMNTGGSFGKKEKNPHREMWIGKQGFAVLDIDWQSSGPALTSSFYDFKGTLVHSQKVKP